MLRPLPADGGTPGVAVVIRQNLSHPLEAEYCIERPQEVVGWHMVFKPEAVKQLFRCALFSHHGPFPPLLNGRTESQETADDNDYFSGIGLL